MTITGRDDEQPACALCTANKIIHGTTPVARRVRQIGRLTLVRAHEMAAGTGQRHAPSCPLAATGRTEQPAPVPGAGVLPPEVQGRVDAAVSELNERFPLPPGVEFAYEPTEDGPAV